MTAEAMSSALGSFRDEHRRLRRHIDELEVAARELVELSPEERQTMVGRIVAFLAEEIEPHARGEEEVLYPALEAHLKPHALARMAGDHTLIARFKERLVAADASDTTSLQETLYDLQGLLATHFKKEEEVFLPLLGRESEAELDRLAKAMAEASNRDWLQGPEEVERCLS